MSLYHIKCDQVDHSYDEALKRQEYFKKILPPEFILISAEIKPQANGFILYAIVQNKE